MSIKPYDEPIHAAAEHGAVVLEGPDGLATCLTPSAAKRSARHIADAAQAAEDDPDAEGAYPPLGGSR